MVARIRSGKSIKGAINYNEKKVREGRAEIIEAKFYHKNLQGLNFHDKLNRLRNLAERNTRTTTNCLHVSLNFDPSERLTKEKLIQVAEHYMKGIGFESQPYLVYHHHDAAHQHIHIVSTNIDKSGARISLHNLGRIKSEKVRKEIEVKFNLAQAGKTQENKLHQLKRINLEKALYGKMETKRAITNIVNGVMEQYCFASLPEFNAILQLYRITANRGVEGTRMHEKGGLNYSLLDDRGNKIGVPIKASNIYNKPTLKALESKFQSNMKKKQEYRVGIRQKLSKASEVSISREAFSNALKQMNIDIILRTNGQDFMYGITYIDHETKTVFNGSDLGKEWSAAALRLKWAGSQEQEPVTITTQERPMKSTGRNLNSATIRDEKSAVEILIEPTPSFDYVPRNLKKKRKRKGRKI